MTPWLFYEGVEIGKKWNKLREKYLPRLEDGQNNKYRPRDEEETNCKDKKKEKPFFKKAPNGTSSMPSNLKSRIIRPPMSDRPACLKP